MTIGKANVRGTLTAGQVERRPANAMSWTLGAGVCRRTHFIV
jgi:hypothetical protein